MSDRKYGQRGYQDGGTERSRPAPDRPVLREGPRGRGLGAPTATVFRCAACGVVAATDVGAVVVGATCPACAAALHSCRHCVSFDPSARFECRANIVTPIRSKSKGNECALFAPRLTAESAAEGSPSTNNARAAFDALFKS